jgi:ATP-binding cassette, subfamily B, bacterial
VALLLLTGRVVGRLPSLVAGAPIGDVAVPLTALAVVFVADAALPAAIGAVVQNLGNRITEDVAIRLVDPMLAPPGIEHLEDPAVADEVNRGRGKFGFAVSLGVRAVVQVLGLRLAAAGTQLWGKPLECG